MILLSEPNNDMPLQTANETRTWKHKIASKERARVATTTNYNSTINEWAMMDLERGRGQCARLKDQTVTLYHQREMHCMLVSVWSVWPCLPCPPAMA